MVPRLEVGRRASVVAEGPRNTKPRRTGRGIGLDSDIRSTKDTIPEDPGGPRDSEARQSFSEEDESHAGADVEEHVGDHERPGAPPPPQEEGSRRSRPSRRCPRNPPQPWYRWYDPRSSALAPDRSHRRPGQLLQPRDQVAEDDHLLDHARFDRVHDERRDRPPVAERRDRHDEPVHAELHGRQVHTDPGDPDDHEHEDAADEISISARSASSPIAGRPSPLRRTRWNTRNAGASAEDEPEDLAGERVRLVGGRDDRPRRSAPRGATGSRTPPSPAPTATARRGPPRRASGGRRAPAGRASRGRTRIRVGLHRNHCTHR